MANLGLEWDVPGTGGLTLTGQAVYTSSQYADAANKQELPAWTRFDLGARYLTELDGHLLTLRANVINVANKRSEEHTSELQSLMRISYAVFCLKKKNKKTTLHSRQTTKQIRHTKYEHI